MSISSAGKHDTNNASTAVHLPRLVATISRNVEQKCAGYGTYVHPG